MEQRNIVITEQDMERLQCLIDVKGAARNKDLEHLAMLQQELDRAQVVASIDVPATVVTLDSRVRLRNLDTGEDEMYTLVLPQNSDFARKRISVLAPIGTAVLGYQVGDVIEWEVPGGKRRLRVEEILFQPERAARASGGNALFVEENEKCQQPAPAC